MAKSNNIVKYIAAAIFVIFLIGEFIRDGAYTELEVLSNYLSQKEFEEEESVTMDSLETEFTSSMYNQKNLIDINGLMANKLSVQGFYSDMGMYITGDKYIVSASNYTSTDYEYLETISFRDFLEENGINFMYVNEPTKYVDDSLFRKEFGVETYSNRNMDLFISRIRAQGVVSVDLRENIEEENINVADLFYRTDHHWTTPAGLWAAQIIADGLNKNFDYNIDTSIYNIENYIVTEWKECWLGEQGRKVAESYVGLDGYTELKPKFKTSFTFKNRDGATWEGTFDDFINESVYNTENDVYENESWHYSYARIDCINNNISEGKILLLGDSFDHVTQPFLALGVHEIHSLVLRDYDDSFSLRDYILENGYDTVIVAYAQFMLGAHDNSESANYRMFTFDY